MDREIAWVKAARRAFEAFPITVQRRMGRALDVAAVAFLLWEEDDDRRAAYDAGVRWELRAERQPGDHLEWSLEPLHV